MALNRALFPPSDVLYINALAAPNTINTMPEKTLLAFSDHRTLDGTLRRDGGDCERVLAVFRNAGVDLDKLAADLQSQGAEAFVHSWSKLLTAIEAKAKVLQTAASASQPFSSHNAEL
ncbi:MAG: transaldolase family protein [Bryobacteraceae bacterium]